MATQKVQAVVESKHDGIRILFYRSPLGVGVVSVSGPPPVLGFVEPDLLESAAGRSAQFDVPPGNAIYLWAGSLTVAAMGSDQTRTWEGVTRVADVEDVRYAGLSLDVPAAWFVVDRPATVEEVKSNYILRAIRTHGGNRREAAEAVGVSYKMMRVWSDPEKRLRLAEDRRRKRRAELRAAGKKGGPKKGGVKKVAVKKTPAGKASPRKAVAGKSAPKKAARRAR